MMPLPKLEGVSVKEKLARLGRWAVANLQCAIHGHNWKVTILSDEEPMEAVRCTRCWREQ